jgi:hypothetical protein
MPGSGWLCLRPRRFGGCFIYVRDNGPTLSPRFKTSEGAELFYGTHLKRIKPSILPGSMTPRSWGSDRSSTVLPVPLLHNNQGFGSSGACKGIRLFMIHVQDHDSTGSATDTTLMGVTRCP